MPVSLDDAKGRMDKSLEALESEFKTIRTGRANTAMFDKVRIEYYGQQTPLSQVATISVPEARLVIIQPWDPSTLGDIERGLQKAELSLNPSNDGKVIRIAIPPLTEERRKEIVKVAHGAAEQARVSVRNIRRDLNEETKAEQKAGLSEDEAHRLGDGIQKLTDAAVANIEKLLAAKEAEILEI
jgi:ribosome recycling factor